MREPQRLLARLNPVSLDWKNSSKTTGDILTAQDVAAALSGMPRGPYLLLLYLWGDDSTVEIELYKYLLNEVSILAKVQKWKCKDENEKLVRLVQLALREKTKPKICSACKGTGVKINIICDVCSGGGDRRYANSECARIIGIKASNWKKCWGYKYYQVLSILEQWESESVSHLMSRLD